MDEIDFKTVKLSVNDSEVGYKIYSPPQPSWRCNLSLGIYYDVIEGYQPNAFHRFMQKICFGIEWSRIND